MSAQTQTQITTLEDRLAAAERKLAKLPAPTPVPGGRLDHGMLNLPLAKRTNLDSDIRKGAAIIAAEEEVSSLRARVAYAKKNAPVPFTPEELKAARAIRTSSGWHRVVKVNAKSVTVATGYSWNDRYTLDKVLEVRA
jgi:hypothetical protein